MNKKSNTGSWATVISRQNKSMCMFLLDQSGSMDEDVKFMGSNMTKSQGVAKVVNTALNELIIRCKKEDECRHYFDISVLGYNNDQVTQLIPYNLPSQGYATPSWLSNNIRETITINTPVTLPDGTKTMVSENHKVWIRPHAAGNTPMYSALCQAHAMISTWVNDSANRNSYPPTLINITDGEATDGTREQLLSIAESIKLLKTEIGNVIFINVRLFNNNLNKSILFPSDIAEMGDDKYGRLLFEMSSPIPEFYRDEIVSITNNHDAKSFRGVCYNAHIVDLIRIMNIGSVSVQLL